VRDGALDARDLEEVLLGLLDALRDRRRHLLGLAVADADRAVAVADDDQGGEAEATTALDDLGHAVDRDDALDERCLLGGTATGATVAPVTAPAAVRAAHTGASALGSSHQKSLISLPACFPVSVIYSASPPSRAPSAIAATRPW
jgi:hypothetical protein